jgi:hypothetical protein
MVMMIRFIHHACAVSKESCTDPLYLHLLPPQLAPFSVVKGLIHRQIILLQTQSNVQASKSVSRFASSIPEMLVTP